MRMFKKEEGFTLVELMVVVLIIGILVAIAIPVFNSATKTARERTCFANERTLEGAAEQWLAQDPNNAFLATDDYAALIAHVVPDYVKVMPECPETGVYAFDPVLKKVTCGASATVTTFTGHGHFSD
ncbi:MAG: type II secretion system protein [Coriobacteriia bacterium]